MLILKEKDTVYIALSGTTYLCTGSADPEWATEEENLAVWKVPNEDNIIVGMSGCHFIGDLFRYDEDFIRGELTQEKIILEVIPKIKKRLRRYDSLKKNDEMHASFVFAQKDRAFYVGKGFSCSEIEQFDVSGTGGKYAYSTFRLSEGLPPEQRLLFVDHLIKKGMNYPGFPLKVINTKTCKPYIIKP